MKTENMFGIHSNKQTEFVFYNCTLTSHSVQTEPGGLIITIIANIAVPVCCVGSEIQLVALPF
jgi:hypothetical protein